MDNVKIRGRSFYKKQVNMIRYLLVMAMIILTPPKGSGGHAPRPEAGRDRGTGVG